VPDAADLIWRTDAADADELADLFRSLDPASARTLRAALGDDVYGRLRAIAVQLEPGAARRRPRGNVVVVPDLFGSALVRRAPGREARPVWVRARALVDGSFGRLRLDEDTHDDAASVVAVGALKRPYGELLLTLAGGWTVRTFAYDWRRDLSIAAAQLGARVREWFPTASRSASSPTASAGWWPGRTSRARPRRTGAVAGSSCSARRTTAATSRSACWPGSIAAWRAWRPSTRTAAWATSPPCCPRSTRSTRRCLRRTPTRGPRPSTSQRPTAP
jgi:hypothetical protein